VAGKLDLMTAWYHVTASNARKHDFLLQMYQSFRALVFLPVGFVAEDMSAK
jgi:hypothetical protein